jgi:cell shape-determining protein MreC
MPNDSPSDNRAYCKAYYERLKQDPQKLAERQAKKAEAQRLRRAKGKQPTCDLTVTSEPEPVASPVTSPEPEDILARIHRLYKEECESLGYDVDGNRRAVQ